MIKYLRAVFTDTSFNTIELLRLPAYSIPTLVLPAMLYAFFALPYSNTPEIARIAVASYAAFAVIGVALFQFGVGIANDRISPWESYLRTLPIPASARLLARLLSALLFGIATASIVLVLGVIAGHVSMGVASWVRLVLALLMGGIVFAVIGIALGYWTSPKAAVPITNLVYLPLAFIGGLWIPPQFLPKVVAGVSPFTPTRQYGELVWASASGVAWPRDALVILAVYAIVFFIIALWGYRRDEVQRYG